MKKCSSEMHQFELTDPVGFSMGTSRPRGPHSQGIYQIFIPQTWSKRNMVPRERTFFDRNPTK